MTVMHSRRALCALSLAVAAGAAAVVPAIGRSPTPAPIGRYSVTVQDINGERCICANAGVLVLRDASGRELLRALYSSKATTERAVDTLAIRHYWSTLPAKSVR